MQAYYDSVQTNSGAAVPNVSIYVYTNAGTLATIYSDNGITLAANPLITGLDGSYSFFAANGTYRLEISGVNYVPESKPGIVLFDPADESILGLG